MSAQVDPPGTAQIETVRSLTELDSAYPSRSASVWSYRPGLEPAAFPRTNWGHRGYDEFSVDSFVQQVIKDRDAAELQITDLRAEIDRLHRYIRRQWAAVAAAETAGGQPSGRSVEGPGLVSPAAQARAVLSQAQEIADRRLAEAEARLSDAERQFADRLESADHQVRIKLMDADRQVSRLISAGEDEAAQRLTRVDMIAEQVLIEARQDAGSRRAKAEEDAARILLLAKTRYEDIVVRAHQRADRAAEVALTEIEHPTVAIDAGRVRAELEMKAAYLRTFAKVSRAALQTALNITAREFDRLLGASASTSCAASAEPAGPDLPRPVSADPVLADPVLADPLLADPLLAGPALAGAISAVRPRPRLIVLPDTEAAKRAALEVRAGRLP